LGKKWLKLPGDRSLLIGSFKIVAYLRWEQGCNQKRSAPKKEKTIRTDHPPANPVLSYKTGQLSYPRVGLGKTQQNLSEPDSDSQLKTSLTESKRRSSTSPTNFLQKKIGLKEKKMGESSMNLI